MSLQTYVDRHAIAFARTLLVSWHEEFASDRR